MGKVKSIQNCRNKYNMPKNFIIKKGKLYYLKTIKDSEEKKEIYLSSNIIVNSKVYSFSNNNYFYEIAIVNDDYKIKNSELFSSSEIGQKSGIIKGLGNKLGIVINEINYKYFLMYLSEFINLNKIETKKAIDTLGWHNEYFAPYSSELTFDYTMDKQNVLRNIVDNMNPTGDKAKWKELIKSYSSYDFDFIMGISFASPLMKFLGRRTFQALSYGESNSGKTFAGHCGLSVWIKPSIAKIGKLDTRNTVMEKVYLFQNIFILVDDCINKGNEKTVINLYDIPNEKNRGRLSKDSQLTKEKSWRTTALITSESKITEFHSLEGEYNRTLEIKGKYVDDVRKVKKDYEFLENNYALVGEEYINYISKLGKEYLLNKLEKIENKLFIENENALNDHVSSVSIACLGVYLFKKLLFKVDDIEYCIKIGSFILSKLPKKNDIDVHKNALNSMYDYYEMNKNCFITDNNKCESNKILGVVRAGEIIFITQPLREHLEKMNFNFSRDKERLMNCNLLEYKQARIYGSNGRRYVIPLENPLIKEENNKLIELTLLLRNNIISTINKTLDIPNLEILRNTIKEIFKDYDTTEIEEIINKKINQIKSNRGKYVQNMISKNESNNMISENELNSGFEKVESESELDSFLIQNSLSPNDKQKRVENPFKKVIDSNH